MTKSRNNYVNTYLWNFLLCIAMEGISEDVVLSTVLSLFRSFIVLFWLLIIFFNGDFGDVFLTEGFVERGLVNATGSLTAFWIFKSIEVGILFGPIIE